ncbi:hypothetical protein N9Q99_01790 [Flavobacteriales bacterium]|nr:hypothetical protein [Flavobacteriales bacterium]
MEEQGEHAFILLEIELDSDRSSYYYYRGKCRFELYDYENVIPDMDFEIENNSQDTFSYYYYYFERVFS